MGKRELTNKDFKKQVKAILTKYRHDSMEIRVCFEGMEANENLTYEQLKFLCNFNEGIYSNQGKR